MFGAKKEIAALRESLERQDAERRKQEKEREERLLARIAELEKKLAEGTGKQDGLTLLGEKINRHDLAIGDLVDSLEEMMAEQQNSQQELAGELRNRNEKELRDALRREEKLLALAIAYQEQLFALENAAACAEDPSWQRQIESAGEKILGVSVPAGFQRIGQKGEPFSYDLHEAIETRETEDPRMSMKVAEAYTCGAMYQGRVIRKAKVAVYRAAETEEA